TKCSSSELVATSCEPPADECPMAPTGSSPPTASASSGTVQPQLRTARLPTVTTAAAAAVSSHACAAPSCGTALTTAPKVRPLTGRPIASATVSGTINDAATHHSAPHHVTVLSAAYPLTLRYPVPCGGAKNAANSADPVVSAAAASAMARTT